MQRLEKFFTSTRSNKISKQEQELLLDVYCEVYKRVRPRGVCSGQMTGIIRMLERDYKLMNVSKGDDLTKVKGVGKATEIKLNKVNIFTYAELAEATEEQKMYASIKDSVIELAKELM